MTAVHFLSRHQITTSEREFIACRDLVLRIVPVASTYSRWKKSARQGRVRTTGTKKHCFRSSSPHDWLDLRLRRCHRANADVYPAQCVGPVLMLAGRGDGVRSTTEFRVVCVLIIAHGSCWHARALRCVVARSLKSRIHNAKPRRNRSKCLLNLSFDSSPITQATKRHTTVLLSRLKNSWRLTTMFLQEMRRRRLSHRLPHTAPIIPIQTPRGDDLLPLGKPLFLRFRSSSFLWIRPFPRFTSLGSNTLFFQRTCTSLHVVQSEAGGYALCTVS